MNYTYIVECGDGSLYTGWTNNLEKRIQAHNVGKTCGGAQFRERREIYEEPSAGEAGVFGNICHEGRGNEPGVCD